MKRGAVVGIAAGAVAITVAVGVIWWLTTRPASADDVAQAYLQALQDGDFTSIEPLLPAEGIDDADRAQLETAFDGATGYITEYAYELAEESAGSVGVRAEVELAGESAVVLFELERRDGSYALADFLATIEPTTTMGDSVRVGDALVTAGARHGVLPAVYPVSAAPAGLMTGGVEVPVTNEDPVTVTVTVDASLSPAAVGAAQEQLDRYADQCALPAAQVPENCGLRVPWAADLATLDSIAFRIDQHPVVALAGDGAGFDATGGVIVATATGVTRDGRPGVFTYRTDGWALRGSLRFSGDEMVLVVR